MQHGYMYVPFICLLFLLPTNALSQGDPAKGKSLYGTCAACHGPNAEGMLATNSPSLSGMRDSYLVSQIQKFRSGARGANPEDFYGAQMAAMAKVLPDEQAILDVVAYIVTLKAPSPKRTEMSGDPSRGKKIYEEQACSQCHATRGQGMQGKGRPKYDSPRLAGQHDWYLIRQLKNFKSKIRGSKDNPSSMLMRVQLVEFSNDQMFKDVVAYIGTFEN